MIHKLVVVYPHTIIMLVDHMRCSVAVRAAILLTYDV